MLVSRMMFLKCSFLDLILEQKISDCLYSIFSCSSSIRKGYRQVKMRFLIAVLLIATDGSASSISKLLLR